MSIVFHHFKILKEHLDCKNIVFSKEKDNNINNQESIILQKKLEKWKTYSDILRQPNRELFNQMLQSCYKYSSSIYAKGENYPKVT